ncbi:enoyl-CoA hydratase-related protein [Caballeronia sp. LZ034LL]|uniref:enoyl-CoA hydratase/isomerase family protein n=1 Tax=Caballeronia sp. LZ034LL TaxID=3038567 RepID=UPI002861CB9E|nr:enoyl-CoA hydratase-related protein [Caballeronia sp. LZ034LL]MDR5833041.1 enoyl-CoA hydratase-related protein [Caballeronia sp. LZ034LL]
METLGTIDMTQRLVPLDDSRSGIVQLTLHGTTPANVLDTAARQRIIVTLEAAAADPEVAALILSGPTGGAFCGGGDAQEVSNLNSESDVDVWLDSIMALYHAILRFPKPVIAAIDGQVKGQGLQLALLCDIRIAAYGARFSEPELAQGVSCAVGAAMLRHFVPHGVVSEMVYGCKEFGAITALEHSLINFAVREHELMPMALHWARRLADHAPAAFAHTKGIIAQNLMQALTACLPAARATHRQLLVRPCA